MKPLTPRVLCTPKCTSHSTTAAADGVDTRRHCMRWICPASEARCTTLLQFLPHIYRTRIHEPVFIALVYWGNIYSTSSYSSLIWWSLIWWRSKMTRSVRVMTMCALRPTRLYHDGMHPPPLSMASFVCWWRPIIVVSVDLWCHLNPSRNYSLVVPEDRSPT